MTQTATSSPATALELLASVLRGVVAGMQVEALPVEVTPDWWRRFDEIARLASAAKLLLARRVDESEAARRAGLRSTAEWFAQTAGTSLCWGQELLAASKRIADLPELETAVRAGALSSSQVGPLTHAAEADPEAQAELVRAARVCSMRELLERCAKIRANADPDPERTAERIREERRLRFTRDTQGGFCLSGRGPVEEGAELDTVLRAITDEIFREAHTRDRREPHEAYRWDALIETARRAWAFMHGATTRTGAGETSTSPDSPASGDTVPTLLPEPDPEPAGTVGAPRPRRRHVGVNPWSRAVLRVEWEALVRGYPAGEETCDIAGIGPVPVSVARRLLGESTLHLVITKGVAVRKVTYLGRGPNAAQRIALLWEQPECSRLGCPRPARENDHREDYARTHHTRVDELDPLCDHDHDLKTHQGWALVAGRGKRPMVPPGHPDHPGNPTYHPRRRRRPPGATTGTPSFTGGDDAQPQAPAA